MKYETVSGIVVFVFLLTLAGFAASELYHAFHQGNIVRDMPAGDQ